MALYRLPRLIGLARAQELILLGEPIPAREAARIGLVHRVVPAGDLATALDETVERLLALPPASARASKALLARAFDLDAETFRRAMQERFAGCLASDEHHRAMAAIRTRGIHA
jgi:enoyl-CoA hydratase/carnithine racemase